MTSGKQITNRLTGSISVRAKSSLVFIASSLLMCSCGSTGSDSTDDERKRSATKEHAGRVKSEAENAVGKSNDDDNELEKLKAYSRKCFLKTEKKEDFYRPPIDDTEREAVKICTKAAAILDARREAEDKRDGRDTQSEDPVDAEVEKVKKEYGTIEGSRAIQDALLISQKATAMAPKHPLAWNLLAACHYTMGDREAGDAAVEKACSLDPYYVVAWKNRGVIAAERRNWTKAAESFGHCARLIPENPKISMMMGRVNIEMQRGDEAIKWFQKTLEIAPKNANAWYQLGYAYHCMKRFTTAEEMYNKALSFEPTHEDALRYLLIAQRGQKKFAEAEKTIVRMTQVIPQRAIGWIELGNLRRARGDFYGMKQAYREVFKHDRKNSEGIIAEGEYYANQKKFEEAKNYFEQARKLNPSWSRPWHLLGQLAMDVNDYKGAEKYYSVAAKLRPNAPFEWNSLGCAVASQGRIPEAEKFFKTAVEKDPSYAQGWSNLSLIARDMGRKEEAIELGLKALKIDPNRTNSLCNLADLYYAGGRLREAESLAQKALRVDPTSADAWIALGAIAAGKKDADAAVKCFVKATELEPENKSAWKNLSEVYKLLGDKKAEANALRMAIKSKNTDHPDDLYSMAYKLESLGHKDDARAAMKQGLNMDPSEADVLMNVPYAMEQSESKSSSK